MKFQNSKILFIDKRSGITSFDVIRQLRRRLRQAQLDIKMPKMGHAGTLDPLATGLLIIGVEEGTKRLSEYTDLPKEYEVLIEFGKTSTTYDADGEVNNVMVSLSNHDGRLRQAQPDKIAQPDKQIFEKTLQQFIGDIEQMPPQFSAKRINGQRAYDLARQGKIAALKPAAVHIESIEILEWNWPEVKLRVKCGKGTYIRSLAHDLGQQLGCGGYVKELRRTAIGEFRADHAERI